MDIKEIILRNRRNIESLIGSNITAYKVAKDTGLTRTPVTRLYTGESKIDNLNTKTNEILSLYWEMNKMKFNKDSLDIAIKEFNEWDGAARIYIDKDDGFFETSVYPNDASMAESLSTDNYFGVYSKREIDTNANVGEKRRKRIERYAELILNGWEPIQAEEKLYQEGY